MTAVERAITDVELVAERIFAHHASGQDFSPNLREHDERTQEYWHGYAIAAIDSIGLTEEIDTMSMVWDWHVPDIYEIQRAQDFIGWAYEGGTETAVEMYQEKYGELPCWAKNEPDMGLLTAVNALWKITNGQRQNTT